VSPPLAVTQPDGSRRYRHPLTGEVEPSVTTILKIIAKPNVDRWISRKTAEFTALHLDELDGLSTAEKAERIRASHEEISGAARDLGTAIHETIDSWQKGEAAADPEGAGPYLNRFIDWVLDVQPSFIENECTLWSRTHGYAGTADAIAEINNKVYLLDFKTGKGVYAEAALQVSALAGADFIITPEGEEKEIPALDLLAAVHIRPRSCRLIPVSGQEENMKAFLAARQILRWQEEVAPNVFLGG
jgi:hypothetical protein